MAMRDKAAMTNQYPNQAASTARAGHSMTSRRHMGASRIACAAAALLLLVCSSAPLVAQGTVAPIPKVQWFDNNGDVCNGCLLYTYAAGTTTPQATYTTAALTIANANPVVADSAGRMTVFLSAVSYKFVLKTSAGVTLWTVDNVTSVGMAGNGVGFELAALAGSPDSPITATSYPSGTTFATCHAGTLWFTIDAANIPSGTYALEGMMLASGGTVTAALVNLSDGAPDTAMVTIASTSSTGERQQSSAITFAASGASKTYGVKVKVSAGYGLVWALRLVRIS